jgi:hypothetical protein
VAEDQSEWLQYLGRIVPEEWRLKKANKVTSEARVTQVMEWLVQGWTRREIVAEVEKLFGLKSSRADDLLRLARQQFVKDYEDINRKELVAESIERYDFLYKAGVSQRQLAVSIAAIQAKLKMLGVDSVKS